VGSKLSNVRHGCLQDGNVVRVEMELLLHAIHCSSSVTTRSFSFQSGKNATIETLHPHPPIHHPHTHSSICLLRRKAMITYQPEEKGLESNFVLLHLPEVLEVNDHEALRSWRLGWIFQIRVGPMNG
jgi:hypothetical protein